MLETMVHTRCLVCGFWVGYIMLVLLSDVQ